MKKNIDIWKANVGLCGLRFEAPEYEVSNLGLVLQLVKGEMPAPRGHLKSALMCSALDNNFGDVMCDDGFIYQVHFKRAHRNFIRRSDAPEIFEIGDIVIVDADRGVDLGVVVSKVPASEFKEFIPTAGYRGRGFGTGSLEKKCILRLATTDEKSELVDKVVEEEIALQIIRAKTFEQRLQMIILDAEYQYDRHKLVVYFEAFKRVDFRELVTDLFSTFKTRIWMQQVDASNLPDHSLRTQISTSTGLLMSSYSAYQIERAHERIQLNIMTSETSNLHKIDSVERNPGDAYGCLSSESIDWSMLIACSESRLTTSSHECAETDRI